MNFITHQLTNIGLKRKINEDAILVNSEKNLFLLADGMGGLQKGDIASNIVVSTINEIINTNRFLNITNEKHLEELFQNSIEIISNKLIKYSKEQNITDKMGSTIVGAYKNKIIDKLCFFNMGDSRLYRIRGGILNQLTKDHSIYEEKKEDPTFPKENLKLINKNVLSKAIGNFSAFKLDINFTSLEDNDIYILCSDGIYNFIKEKELTNIILNNQIETALEMIKNIVFNNGAKDNLSLIITKYYI